MVGDLRDSTVSRRYLDDILQSIGEILIVTDLSGTIRMVNRAAVERLGYEREELTDADLSSSGLSQISQPRCSTRS